MDVVTANPNYVNTRIWIELFHRGMGQCLYLPHKCIDETSEQDCQSYYRLPEENASIALIWGSTSFGITQNIFLCSAIGHVQTVSQ